MKSPKSNQVRTIAGFAQPLLLAAAFSSTWTAFNIGGLQLVDIFLVILLPVILFDALSHHTSMLLPTWIGIPVVAVVFIGFFRIFAPTEDVYMKIRFTLLPAERADVASGSEGALVTGIRWLVALAIVPAFTAYLTHENPKILPRLAMSWALGAAVSAVAAVTDFLGVTGINVYLTDFVHISGRQGGLSSHPNNLGVACAIAIPAAMYLFTRHHTAGVITLVALLAGTALSGSRGSQVAALLAVVLTLLLSSSSRKVVLRLLIVAAAVGFALVAIFPDTLTAVLGLFRFSDSSSVEQSDLGRELLARQAVADFGHDPAFGIGLEILTHAHSVPLQLLASGGLALATSMTIFFIGAVSSGWRNRTEFDGLTGTLTVSVLIWIGLGLIENQLTDRFLYFPIAVIAGVALIPRIDKARQRRAELMAATASWHYIR